MLSIAPNYSAYQELLPLIHVIHCEVNISVLILKLRPMHENFTGEFFIFMDKFLPLSYTNHHWNCTLPNPEPENFWNMTDAERNLFASEQKWRCYFDSDALNNTCTGRLVSLF